MKIKINLKLLISLLFIASYISPAASEKECFLIMAGKNATADGKIYLAHNNDLSGVEASGVSRYAPGSSDDYIPDHRLKFDNDFGLLIQETNLGFAEGDAVATNEAGVAVAGGLSLKNDRSERAKSADPLIKTGLGGGVRYFALSKAKTARECIEIIGKCCDTYGISYPSGVGVADTNEIWYFEAGGGKSWAAVRIPDSVCFIGANSYRIGKIDFEDTLNYIYSDKVKELASGHPDFSFKDFFGGGVKEKSGNNFYNTRRIWRASMLLNPDSDLSPDAESHPFLIKPKEKVSLEKCFSILRDYYNKTGYSIYKNDTLNSDERAIAIWNCVHTSVISLSPGEDVGYGAILWSGLSTPFTGVYVPFYLQGNVIPAEYGFMSEDFDATSAFWIYKRAGDRIQKNFPTASEIFRKKRAALEIEIISENARLINAAKKLHPADRAEFLDKTTRRFCDEALKLVNEELIHRTQTK
jgi:dipeptidase